MLALLAQGQATQLPVRIPEIAWSAISPELVLFGAGILVLLLDTAGDSRLQSSFLVAGAVVAGAVLLGVQTEQLPAAWALGVGGLTQFVLTAIWRDRPRLLEALLAALGFAATAAVTAWQWATYAGEVVGPEGLALVGSRSAIGGMVAVDGVALFTRVTVCAAGLVTVLLGYAYAEERRIHRGEYYPLVLFAATGMNLLAASADLIMVFISIEILSLSLYILCGFAKRDLHSQEAALKYFLLGAFSSALLLYGVALVYGVAGSTNVTDAGRALASLDAPRGASLAAMGLLLVGFGFKTALVPFHMWTPDVYQGAPTPVTGFMAAATKAAAFAAFLRVFVGAFGTLQWSWVPVVWLVAAVTMIVGAVLAVVQIDIKRMLGYSAIAHAGYVSIGLIAVSRDGVSATLFYLLAYALMSLGAFGVLALLERRSHRALAIHDLRGLGKSHPLPAIMLALFLVSLAGVPGTAGFMAKFAVFRAGVQAGQAALVVIGVVSSVIAAFFYLRVIVAMFMEDEPADAAQQPPLEFPASLSAGLALSAAAVVALGILPGAVVNLARQAATVVG
ncbi:MAG TPA: NADH-quinone oxidoreductase subunit NuoN [Egibacteraceae bacterium]|nr:NADH-quinone oxidoreductase subunit NuoN [Egibacteraceae bacterium]